MFQWPRKIKVLGTPHGGIATCRNGETTRWDLRLNENKQTNQKPNNHILVFKRSNALLSIYKLILKAVIYK